MYLIQVYLFLYHLFKKYISQCLNIIIHYYQQAYNRMYLRNNSKEIRLWEKQCIIIRSCLMCRLDHIVQSRTYPIFQMALHTGQCSQVSSKVAILCYSFQKQQFCFLFQIADAGCKISCTDIGKTLTTRERNTLRLDVESVLQQQNNIVNLHYQPGIANCKQQ